MSTTRRRWVIGLGIASAALMVFSAILIWQWRAGMRRYEQWHTAVPCDARVDLSQRGTTRTAFAHTCPSAHSSPLLVTIDPPPTIEEESFGPPAAFAGLQGAVVLRDPSGREAWRQKLDVYPARPGEDSAFSLADFTGVPVGSYTLELAVEQPAVGLKGTAQRVVADYWLCGMEALPAVLSGMLGMAAGGLGVVLGIVAAVVDCRGRRLIRSGPA